VRASPSQRERSGRAPRPSDPSRSATYRPWGRRARTGACFDCAIACGSSRRRGWSSRSERWSLASDTIYEEHDGDGGQHNVPVRSTEEGDARLSVLVAVAAHSDGIVEDGELDVTVALLDDLGAADVVNTA
jgi:hypothetical protein